jgi:hypothetical protein
MARFSDIKSLLIKKSFFLRHPQLAVELKQDKVSATAMIDLTLHQLETTLRFGGFESIDLTYEVVFKLWKNFLAESASKAESVKMASSTTQFKKDRNKTRTWLV